MIDFVLDANVLMGILISGKSGQKPILTLNNFILPDFAFIEVDKYKDILLTKTKMSNAQFVDWTYFVFSEVTFLPHYVLEKDILHKTEMLLNTIDLNDTAYVALAMQLELPLLTRDKILFEGLKKQGFRKVLLFKDFLNSF